MRPVVSIFVLVTVLFSSLRIHAQETLGGQPETVIKIFALQHADATRLVNVIQGLFSHQKSPLAGVEARADTRTNSIITTGSRGDLQVVEELLGRLDEKEPLRRGTTVYKLKNAAVEDVARAINDWLSQRAIMEGVARDAIKQTVIVPEMVSNSLIVSTTLDDEGVNELDALIRALDTRPDMVKVKVVIKQKKDGKETILTEPTMVTLDNMQARFSVGTETDSITVELTPRVIRGQEQVEMTRIDGAKESKKR